MKILKELDENTKITIFKEIRNIILNYNKAVLRCIYKMKYQLLI